MITIPDRAALTAAVHDPTLPLALRDILRLRSEQMGEASADFRVLESGDEIEHAFSWPLTFDGSPCWEWIELHPGNWIEVVFILTDDGHAHVLLIPGTLPIAERVRALAD